jgi:hypothetical protein
MIVIRKVEYKKTSSKSFATLADSVTTGQHLLRQLSSAVPKGRMGPEGRMGSRHQEPHH